MHILITGGTGLIGTALVNALLARGDHLTLMVRNFEKAKRLFNGRVNLIASLDEPSAQHSSPQNALLPSSALHIDGVVNLAGEPILDQRWSSARKQQLKLSRISTTSRLVEWLSLAENKPRVLVSGSAVGYYGNHPESEAIDESSPSGTGFAAELCRQWELAAKPAEHQGIRVCTLRTGVVLAAEGGALQRLLLPFRLGLGGRIGNGQQWFPWIHLSDMVKLILELLDNPSIHGPVNASAPQPVTNRKFTQTFASVLRRPAFLPVPALAMKTLLGEASELLLEGQRVIPKKLLDHDFGFDFPELKIAIEDILN